MGKLHPKTRASLPDYAELFDVSQNDHAYDDVLSHVWSEGKGFLCVEHDIELRPDVIPRLTRNKDPWALFGYCGLNGDPWLGALGCTRFSTELLEKEPDLVTRAGSSSVHNEGNRRNWRSLDARILGELNGRGYRATVLEPPVLNHHWRRVRDACDCLDPTCERVPGFDW